MRTCFASGWDAETQWAKCKTAPKRVWHASVPVAELPGEGRSHFAREPRCRRPQTSRQTASERRRSSLPATSPDNKVSGLQGAIRPRGKTTAPEPPPLIRTLGEPGARASTLLGSPQFPPPIRIEEPLPFKRVHLRDCRARGNVAPTGVVERTHRLLHSPHRS